MTLKIAGSFTQEQRDVAPGVTASTKTRISAFAPGNPVAVATVDVDGTSFTFTGLAEVDHTLTAQLLDTGNNVIGVPTDGVLIPAPTPAGSTTPTPAATAMFPAAITATASFE